jgi:hypothetical protein
MVIVKKICGNGSVEKVKKAYADAVVLNMTDKGAMKKLSPKYPHEGIPVPFEEEVMALSVDGIWNGCKVFERRGIDKRYFNKDMMKEVDREIKYGGKCKGFRNGLRGAKLMDEVEARKKILIPAYNWMLENKCGKLVNVLKKISEEKTLVLLDYSDNGDVENVSEPLSYASLLKAKIEG